MRIIGVIDLSGGRAVHASGGCRHGYRPIATIADTPIDGDPGALTRVYRERFALNEVYVADLNAIAGGAVHEPAVRAIAGLGGYLWLDAGISTAAQARRAMTVGASGVVVGLETLTSFDALHEIAAAVGPAAVAFSLDLRDGQPVADNPQLRTRSVDELAAQAEAAGARTIIMLDLARVGSRRGVDLAQVERVRKAAPAVALLIGGGVRDAGDLRNLREAGCDGALIATALHGASAPGIMRYVASVSPGS